MMETPICVTDAQTLTEHIHEIKNWIYNGHLRLIVPSSLAEGVEQLYQKSIEPKPTLKDAPKPKATGKPAKKEYPVFDTNPKIARAYVARLQAGKDYETGPLGRPIYENEERHGAVHFAQPNEQYTPWKDVEEVEEKAEIHDDRPESWADKLRRKQNMANGITENKLPKGPAKPKLVAKTGNDNSPWKVQRNAPSIPATDVPGLLRPMMSCTLWRIHESIHRNDENQVFILTDQLNIQDIAKKLNISVRSTKQTSDFLTGHKTPPNLEVFGELEQEFGMRPVKERRPIKSTLIKPAEIRITNGTTQSNGVLQEGGQSQENLVSKGTVVQGKTSTPKLEGIVDRADHTAPISEVPAPNVAIDTGKHLIEGSGGHSTFNSNSNNANNDLRGSKDETPNTISTSQNGDALLRAPQEDLAEHQSSVTANYHDNGKPDCEEKDTLNSSKILSQPPINNVWSRSWAEALTGNQPRKIPPKHAERSPPTSEQSATRTESPLLLPEAISTQIVAPPADPPAVSAKKTPEEPEDSDEEVVVFQPKRLSAQQKKPNQHNSRPTTPNVQAQSTLASQSPRPSTGRAQHTPRTDDHPPKAMNGAGLAPPKAGSIAPPIIDPDAFGRDFAINTNTTPRGSMRGMRVRHSPQASLHNSGLTTSRPSSSHRQPRGSPNRPSPKTSPRQPPRAPALLEGLTGEAPTVQLPIGAGRPSPTPAPETRGQMLNANAPVFLPASQIASPLPPSPAHQMSVPAPIAPPKLAPIGSGRPSSKTSQQSGGSAEPKPAREIAQQDSAFPRNSAQSVLPEVQRQDPDFVREACVQPRHPSPQKQAPRPANRPYNSNPPSGPQQNTPANRLSSGFAPRGRGGAAPRPVKPSLFNPELDHTRAYQSDTEPRKSVVPQEVQYVLKSGSTREQARGRGKLWVG